MDFSSVSKSSTPSRAGSNDDDDFDVVERDPTGRYVRHAEILGEGASKTVYKAFDEDNGIEVAWNQIELSDEIFNSEKELQKLYSEATLIKSLKHENVIRCFHSWVDTDKKTINMITELFTSGNLRLYRDKHGFLDKKAIKNWARQILRGLDYLHSQNPPIVHRDLKCENIFVNGNSGKIKIGDLGLATVLQHATAHSVIGTPEFMAPELYEEDYDQRVDIYSFGMCMLQMITRELPYSECKNAAQIFKKVTTGIKPAALSKVKDPQVRDFIDKCLAPASERSSAIDLLKDPFLALDDSGRRTCSPSPTESVCSSLGSSSTHCISDSQLKVAVTEMNAFKLRGEIMKEDSLSLTLWIADLEGVAKRVDFAFFVQDDTVLSVTREMAKELNLSAEDGAVIAKLMEELISELVPGYRSNKASPKLFLSEDVINLMSNVAPKEANQDDQGLQELVLPAQDSDCACLSSNNVAPKDANQDDQGLQELVLPAQDSECACLSSKYSSSNLLDNRSFNQDQEQKHDDHDDNLQDKRKGTKKSYKDLAIRKMLLSCFMKMLFQCSSKSS